MLAARLRKIPKKAAWVWRRRGAWRRYQLGCWVLRRRGSRRQAVERLGERRRLRAWLGPARGRPVVNKRAFLRLIRQQTRGCPPRCCLARCSQRTCSGQSWPYASTLGSYWRTCQKRRLVLCSHSRFSRHH
jgi:hypothetical protein